MDVSKNVLILMVVIIALVVLGILWQLMNMSVTVSVNLTTLYHGPGDALKYMNADVDECTLNTHNCEHTCENTIRSFLCGCNAGYELISDGRTCGGMNKTTIYNS